jgi:chromate reductase
MSIKIGVIVGSNAKDSINLKLAKALVKLGESKADFSFIKIDDLPIYNRDLDNTPPESVVRVKNDLKAVDAFLFVTPEYNRSVPALLKNVIDWASRPASDGYWRKPTAVTGTSPGGIGTGMAQTQLKSILADMGGPIVPGGVYLQFKPDMIDEDGNIANEDTQKFLTGFIDKAITFFAKNG